MVALKMAVDGTLIVLKVSPVRGDARERSVADLGYSNGKVSRKVMEAYFTQYLLQPNKVRDVTRCSAIGILPSMRQQENHP